MLRLPVTLCFLLLVGFSAPTSASIISDLVDTVTGGIEDVISTITSITDLSSLIETIVSLIFQLFSTTYYEDFTPEQNATYDFIIVGSGTSGSILANRLSEISNWTILVLEYGKEAPVIVDVPIVLFGLQYTSLDYNYYAEYDNRSCRACTDGIMHLARGKAIGGTSEINYMIHTRGNKDNFDTWKELGNDGWGYDDVLPYFIKSESASGVSIQDSAYHGTDGPVNVTDVPYRTGIAKAFINASQEAGYSYVDSNGAKQLGVSWTQAALRDGTRCSEEKAYLRAAKDRSNLDITYSARVTRILINEENNTATGVTFTKDGVEYTVNANKEVIVTAGSYNSPQLLMVSGVGPSEDLEKFNIPVKKELPVGKVLYDHLVFTALVYLINDTQSLNRSEYLKPTTYIDYLLNGKGPLTDLGGVEAFCYVNTNTTDTPAEYPDTEIIMFDTTFGIDFGLLYKNIYSISRSTYDKFWKPLEFKNAFQLAPMCAHPYSYGNVSLQSDSMEDPPVIFPNYLSDERDITSFVAAIRESQRLTEQPSFQRYNATLYQTPLPGCEDYTFDSDEYWACGVRGYAITTHHHIATCKMGLENDTTAVVNNRLLVHGFKNLRVADASVMPSTIVAHTNAATIMVAEKAADIIKEDHNVSTSTSSADDSETTTNDSSLLGAIGDIVDSILSK